MWVLDVLELDRLGLWRVETGTNWVLDELGFVRVRIGTTWDLGKLRLGRLGFWKSWVLDDFGCGLDHMQDRTISQNLSIFYSTLSVWSLTVGKEAKYFFRVGSTWRDWALKKTVYSTHALKGVGPQSQRRLLPQRREFDSKIDALKGICPPRSAVT